MPKKGFKFSDESKRKMSLAKLGKPQSETTKQKRTLAIRKLYASKKGKLLRRKLSAAQHQHWDSIPKESRKGRNTAWWKTLSKEDKLKILQSNIEKANVASRKRWAKFAPEERTRMAQDRLSKCKEKLVASMHKFWNAMSPDERRKKMAPAFTKSKELRNAMSPEELGTRIETFIVSASKRLESSLEKKVQNCLRLLKVSFKTHIRFGIYVADIFLTREKTVIEVDGWYHHSSKSAKKRDSQKDAYLKSVGLKVVRIPQREIDQNVMGSVTNALRKIKQGQSL